MHKFGVAILTILAVALFAPALTATSVSAAEKATKIAVVDFNKLQRDSVAAKAVQQKLNAKREALQKELTAKDKSLREKEQALVKQKDSLKPEEFATKRKDFEKELLKAREDIQSKKVSLDKTVINASVQLKTEVVKIIADIADKNGYTIVLSSDDVIVAEKSLDITDEVLKKLNSSLKDISLSDK